MGKTYFVKSVNGNVPNEEGNVTVSLDGGSVGTLQQVTDNGNTTTNDIKVSKLYLKDSASELNGRLYLDSNNWFFEDSDGVVRFIATEGSIFLKNRTSEKEAVINTNLLTANRTYTLPDTSGTIAVTSDIPTELSELNDDSTHRLVTDTQISTWDGKQNTLTETNFGTFSTALTPKTTPVDADTVNLSDSADSNKAKKTTWLNVWTNYLKPKADALYQAILTDVPIKSIIADYTTSSGVTGTNSETLISSYKINANTLSALDFMNITLRLLKTGATTGYLITIRIGTTSTFSTSLTQIAQFGWTLSTGADVNFQRYFKIEGGLLKGSTFTSNILANQGISVNSPESSTSFNVSVDNWIFISVRPQSSNSDVITQSIFKITN